MSWKEIYQQRCTSAENAIKSIKNGDYVVFADAAGIPQTIAKALVENKNNYKDVSIFHMVGLGPGEYMNPEMEGHFRHVTNFVGGNSRKAIEEGRADFYPCYFHKVPAMFRTGGWNVDVAVIHVSRPDENGNCSFGVSCDYTKPAAETAKIVIAEVNDQMPYVHGDNFIHVSKITHIVETSNPLYELQPAKITDVEQAIGRNCASLIEDGDTLQLGIGGIPDAVLLFLKEKKNLGIHTEMFSDGIIELVESGVVNCANKELDKGLMVCTFTMGTKRLYDFINNNPMVKFAPVDYVNDPYVVGKNNNLVSINSCIEIDLQGQVASESMGLRQFSGVGGQVDYVRGADLSKGGKSIMAIPSTAAKGTVSRIVPFLAAGGAVTTNRCDVDYVVTEHGVAKLKGKSLRERAKALISVAHPDFREELKEVYFQRFKERM